MINKLNALVPILNSGMNSSGSRFVAILNQDGILEVKCSNNVDYPIHIVITHEQILTITYLFDIDAVEKNKLNKLNDMFLEINPIIPLSSLGKQGDKYILFGSMPIDTDIKFLMHELEIQAENTIDVLETIESLLN